MSKIQLPPKAAPVSAPEKTAVKKPKNEKQIQAVINRGGGTVQAENGENTEEQKTKNFNILVLESDLVTIGELCNKRPKKPLKKITISKKDWIIEAIQEKIEKEKRKYGL